MELAAAFCEKWNMLPRGSLILCAVSGGRDSMALLHWLCQLAPEKGFRLAAAHFNHQLRAAAGDDEAFVRRWCGEYHVPLSCGSGDVRQFAQTTGASLEDAARILRYRFLEQTAQELGADRIATAHHKEDNAETVLLHLFRGAGMKGLCGIPPVRGIIVRPLLETGRNQINEYIAVNRVPFVEDISNFSTEFTRNRLRLEVLPLLEEIFPGCAGRVADTGALLREEYAHLDKEAQRLLPEAENGEMVLPPLLLEQQDVAVRRRLVKLMGERLGAELSRRHVDAVLDLENGGYLDLPGSVCAVRQAGELFLRKTPDSPPPMVLQMGEQIWGGWRIQVRLCYGEETETPYSLVLNTKAWPLTIAAWDGRGRLTVKNGSRSMKRLFADKGIPVAMRKEHPALFVDGKLAAAFGVAVDETHRPPDSGPRLEVSLLERTVESDDC